MFRTRVLLIAALAVSACSESPPQPEVQANAGIPARPADSTAVLPSDSGSQTTLPTGAVTGAGQPQGLAVQPDVGNPGGLETRARTEARASTTDVDAQRRTAKPQTAESREPPPPDPVDPMQARRQSRE
jgi:hypothetical protein